MLLRSSSTPILGSLLSSFSDTPSRDFESDNKTPSSNFDHHHKKNSFLCGGHHSNFTSFTCNSSPLLGGSSSDLDKKSIGGGFRRAQSDGNLQSLMAAASDVDELHISKMKSFRKPHQSMLQTIPSFSMYSLSNGGEEEEEEEEEELMEFELNEKDGFLKRSITIGDNINGVGGSGDFSFAESMELIKEEELQILSVDDEDGMPKSPPMYLAGLGIGLGFGGGDNGRGGGGKFSLPEYGEGGLNISEMEDYYKRMVEENPGDPLFLRNYAHFLYQSKGDLRGAEEYYSRAILSDPTDGDMLSQYAKIVWELHRDHERAASYFERAIDVSPEDSHVHAAYASFLWETEFEEEEGSLQQDHNGLSFFQTRAMTSASV